MAVHPRSDGSFDEETLRRGVLRGPSRGVAAWTTYWMGVIDWLIDARRRWHEGNPKQEPAYGRLVLSACAGLLALAAIVERIVAG